MSAFCHNCGNELPEGAAFCGVCGVPVSAAPQAPVVEAPAAPVFDEPAAPVYETPVQEPVAPAPKSKKPLIIAGIAAAAVVVLVLLFALLGGSKPKVPEYYLFIKDGEINGMNLGSKDPWEITSKLAKDAPEYSFSDSASMLSGMITLSEDGKTIFFPDRFGSGFNYSFNLYCRSVSSHKKEAVKIASDVERYQVNANGSIVLLLSSDSDLYSYNVKKEDKEKIASAVRSYYSSDDLKTIVYLTYEGDLYRKVGTKDKVKIDSEVTSLVSLSEDLDTVLYRKDDSVYRRTGSKDKEKVDTDISNIVYVSEDLKTVLYIKDENLYSRTGSKDKKKVASEILGVAAKFGEDAIYLYKETDLDADGCSALLFYNGSKVVPVVDGFTRVYTRTYEDKTKPTLVIGVYDEDEETEQLWVVVEKTATKLTEEPVSNVRLSSDGKAVYFLTEVDGNYGELRKAEISGTKVSKPAKYDSDVYYRYISLTADDDICYFKEVDNSGIGDLIVNKKRIDSEVVTASISAKDGAFCYRTEASSSGFTLKYYDGSKSSKIAEEVYDFFVLPTGDVLYLKEYDYSAYTGDLYNFHNGKSTKIATEVTAIIPVY